MLKVLLNQEVTRDWQGVRGKRGGISPGFLRVSTPLIDAVIGTLHVRGGRAKRVWGWMGRL
jgi:hypothetical protein